MASAKMSARGLDFLEFYVPFLYTLCVNSETGEKPGSAGFGPLTKPEGTQGIFILHAPIDSHVQHLAFAMQFGSTARGPRMNTHNAPTTNRLAREANSWPQTSEECRSSLLKHQRSTD